MARPVLHFSFDPKPSEPAEENKPESTTPEPFVFRELENGIFELQGGEAAELKKGRYPVVEVVKFVKRKNTPLQGVGGCFTNT